MVRGPVQPSRRGAQQRAAVLPRGYHRRHRATRMIFASRYDIYRLNRLLAEPARVCVPLRSYVRSRTRKCPAHTAAAVDTRTDTGARRTPAARHTDGRANACRWLVCVRDRGSASALASAGEPDGEGRTIVSLSWRGRDAAEGVNATAAPAAGGGGSMERVETAVEGVTLGIDGAAA